MSRWRNSWSSVLICALALAARFIPGPRTIDDAYITFRYAQNLVSGHGLVYNPGQHVLGTTAPLYALLMGLLSLPFGGAAAPFPVLAWVLNAGLDALACWLLIRLGGRLGWPRAGWLAALIWAVAPWSVTFAIGGMETSLVVTLLLATFYFYYTRHPTAGAAAAAFSLLTRPDAALFLAPLALERLRQQRVAESDRVMPSIGWRELAALGVPLAIWAVAASLYYGRPFPNSIAAKLVAYRLPSNAAFIRFLQHYATPFVGHYTFGSTWIAIGLVLFPTLFLLGALLAIRRMPAAWPMFVSPWLYMAVFSIANPLIFRWYLTPPLPFYFLGILVGFERLGADLRTRWVPLGLGAAAFALTLHGWVIHPSQGPDHPAPEMAYTGLEQLYVQVGSDLAARLAPGQTIAAGDIGALGYTTGAPMLDTLGLISPESLAYYPLDASYYAINYAIPPRLIADLKPDYVVMLEVYGRLGLLRDEDFVRAYRLVETIPTDIYGSHGLFVFELANK